MSSNTSDYNKEWRRRNPQKVAAYAAKHRDNMLLRCAKYNASHREELREYGRLWRAKNPEAVRLQRAKRRARIKGARVEKHIRLAWLHNWTSKVCGICLKPIEGAYQVDHIIPLSRGGEHSTQNLQLAHPFCNRSKHNKLTEQLVMVD